MPGFAFAAGGLILPGAAVYIEEEQLRNRLWKSAMAAAGPMGSALFGLLLVPIFHFSIAREAPSWISGFFAFFIELQCLMTLLNLIPVPPLDGFRIIYAWFPAKWQNQTWFGWGSLMGLIFLFILPLFVPATAIVFNPMFDGVMKIIENLGISEDWVVKGWKLFDRTYTASFLLVVGLVYLSYKPKLILKAAGSFLGFIVYKTEYWFKVENQNERYENLLIIFDKCLKLNPDDSWIWGKKAWNLQGLKRHEEALAAFEKALELDPNNAWNWRQKGWSLQELNRHEEAVTPFEKALKLDPNDVWDWRQKGWSLQELNRHEEALAAFEKALELDPKYCWIWDKKGRSLLKLKRYEEALAAFEKCLKRYPNDAWALGQKGFSFQQLNRHEESLMAFSKAIKLNPKDAWAWRQKGWSLQQLNRHQEALAAFEKALELNPKDSWAWEQKGLSLQQLTALKKSRELNYKNSWAWGTKGLSLQRLKRHEEALTAFEKALELNPKDSWAWGKKGWNLQKLNRHQEALTAFEKYLELNPKDSWAWGKKGWNLQKLNRYEEALAAFEKYIQGGDRELGSDAFLISDVFEGYQEAIVCCEKILQSSPKNALAWSLRGLALQELGCYDAAISSYDLALEYQSDTQQVAEIWNLKGACFDRLKQYPEALESYRYAIEKAIELKLPANRLQDFQSIRGLTLLRLNRREEAVEAYLHSEGMNPSSMQRPNGNLIEIYKP